MAIQKAGRQQFQDIFTVVGVGSFTVDFPNAATGSGTFATAVVPVPGAAFGDFVLVGAGIDVIDAALSAQVTSPGNVEITLLNNTAGAVDLASQTLRIAVLRLNYPYDQI